MKLAYIAIGAMFALSFTMPVFAAYFTSGRVTPGRI
jgi:hypothetical protein